MTPDQMSGTRGDGQPGSELAAQPHHRGPEVTVPPTPDGGEPMGSGRRGLWVAVLIAVALVAVLAGSAMLLRDEDDGAVDTDDAVEEVDPAAGDGAADESAGEGDASGDATPPASEPVVTEEPVPDGPPVPEDGRHPVYVTGIDVGARSLAFDEIELLVGEEAAARRADDPDAAEGPPNDHLIVNDQVEIIGMPVAEQAEVTVVDWAGSLESQPITFEGLPDALADDPAPADAAPDDRWLGPTPFWLTVADGTVTGIEQQYLP